MGSEIVTYTRDQHKSRYLRSYKLYVPDADVGPKTLPDAEAASHADSCAILYYNVKIAGENQNLVDSTGEKLLKKAKAVGIDGKLPATGAKGFVLVSAGPTGGNIPENAELRYVAKSLRYRCTVEGVYKTGDPCPIEGIDTGDETNLPAGTVLEWTSPPGGINSEAVVIEQADGEGLTGGHPEESDGELVDRILARQSNPPASGNDADYADAVRKTPNVPVAGVWTHPCIDGPGTTAIVFTVRTSSPLKSRLPNAAQIASVEAQLKDRFRGDDGFFLCDLLADPVDVWLQVRWTKAAKQWVDATPFPPYVPSGPVRVKAVPTPTTTSCTLLSPSAIADPVVGQTIAFYDKSTGKFFKKKIATVTIDSAGLQWSLTFDATNAASDTTYTPIASQVPSPWSESLTLLVLPLANYFASLGPGEQVPIFFDEGTRQKRQPESPDTQPSIIAVRDIENAPPRSTVSDVKLIAPAASHATTVGAPGVVSYLLTMGEIAVFPL